MRQNNRQFDRRGLLAGAGIAAIGLVACDFVGAPAEAKSFRVAMSEAEWKKKLSPSAFDVLRKEGTERPYSSPLNKEKRAGIFHCKGCDNALFSSKTKFESGTGWPSFYKPLAGAVGTSTDRKLGYARTEVHCARCGGHLGHIFSDGPRPTGKRHCINGLSLKFIPA